MKRTNILFFLLILFSIALSFYFYDLMPEKMASHWNAEGNVNGYMPKFWGIALFPIILIFISILFLILPKIDPMKKNIESFEKEMDIFIALICLFIICIQGFVIAWNLGYEFNIGIVISLSLGVIFFYLGVLLKKTKRNFFMGIRTPWTLSSDIVWDKTHKLGGKLFMISGVLSFIGVFFEKFMIYFILVPLFLVFTITMVYSYYIFKKVKK